MKFLKNQLTFKLFGLLNETNLNELRRCIGLSASGTATDPIGAELGRRTEQHSEYSTITSVILTLVRTRTDECTLTLDATPGTNCDRWRRLIESSCCSAGFAIQEQQVCAVDPDTRERKAVSARRSHVAPRTAEETNTDLPPFELIPALDPALYTVPSLPWLSSAEAADPIRRQRANQIVSRFLPNGIATPISRAKLTGPLSDSIPPGPLPTPPTRQSALDTGDIVTLARGLRNMIWSWRMDDLLGLGEPTMFWTLESAAPGQVSFDTGAVPGYGYICGRGNDAELIDIPVATLATLDDEYSELNVAFDRMATELITAYGEPTSRSGGSSRWIQWDGVENTLTLNCSPPSVRMIVRLNHDVRITYGEEGARRRANKSSRT
ncbi:DUF6301 family protein [Nocardia brasiliensis]